MVTPAIVLLSINCKKGKCAIFNTFNDTTHQKSLTLTKHFMILKFLYLLGGRACSKRVDPSSTRANHHDQSDSNTKEEKGKI